MSYPVQCSAMSRYG